MSTAESPPPLNRRAVALRELRRPIVLAVISAVCLALQHVLLRKMAHGHMAHVLLAAGSHPPPSGAASLAIALLVARFVAYVLVPGLLLAAAAETIAFVLVGPRSDGQRWDRDDDEEPRLPDGPGPTDR